jgi:hypothetical protein
MSAATALSISASVQAAAANQQSHEAKVVACKAYLPTFNAQTATIAEARQYADCVSLAYPHQASGETVLLGKALIVCLLVGAAIGAVRGYQEDGVVGSAMYAFMFAGIVFSLALALGLLVAGVGYLFT